MTIRRTLALSTALAALVAGPALAATPETGEVKSGKLTQKWSGEAAGYGVGLFPEVAGMFCDAPFCDSFTLNVVDTGVLKIAVTGTTFTDLFITGPSGTKEYYAGNGDSATTEAEFIDVEPGAYLIETYTNAPVGLSTGPFSGKATLVLPPATR